jgi:hypothetical protein
MLVLQMEWRMPHPNESEDPGRAITVGELLELQEDWDEDWNNPSGNGSVEVAGRVLQWLLPPVSGAHSEARKD